MAALGKVEPQPEIFIGHHPLPSPGDAFPEVSGSTLLRSTVPLQAEAGAEEPIDLSLESSGGSLRPANPATDLSVPTELGSGIDLPGPGITIELADAVLDSR